MKINEANQLLNEKLFEFGLTEIGWKGQMDNAKRRFGYCAPRQKVISLSRPLTEVNSDAEVLDTILHEIAHALAYIKHGQDCGHDDRWKAICREIGARPEACFDGSEVNLPDSLWVLVHAETGEVFEGFQRKPKNSDYSKVWIRGRKNETYGKLEIRPNKLGEIKKFSRPILQQFNDEIIAAIETVLEDKGVSVEKVKASFSEHEYDLSLRFLTDSPDGKTHEQVDFEDNACLFGLSESDYHREFNTNGENYLLCAVKPNNRKYPIIGLCRQSGKRFKFSTDVLEGIVNS